MRLENQTRNSQEKSERVLAVLMKDPNFARALRDWTPGDVFVNLHPMTEETIRDVSALDLSDPVPDVPDVPDVQDDEARARAGIPKWFRRAKGRE